MQPGLRAISNLFCSQTFQDCFLSYGEESGSPKASRCGENYTGRFSLLFSMSTRALFVEIGGKVSPKKHQFKLHLLLQKPPLWFNMQMTRLCVKSVNSKERLAGTCYGNLGSRRFLKRYLRNKERFITLPATQRLADYWYTICQVLP